VWAYERAVRAALAGDVLVGAGQLAAADVAEQLFDDGQLATAGRGLVAVHGDVLTVFEAEGTHARDIAGAVEGDLGHIALRDEGPVEGVFPRRLADVVPDAVVLEDRSGRRRAQLGQYGFLGVGTDRDVGGLHVDGLKAMHTYDRGTGDKPGRQDESSDEGLGTVHGQRLRQYKVFDLDPAAS